MKYSDFLGKIGNLLGQLKTIQGIALLVGLIGVVTAVAYPEWSRHRDLRERYYQICVVDGQLPDHAFPTLAYPPNTFPSNAYPHRECLENGYTIEDFQDFHPNLRIVDAVGRSFNPDLTGEQRVMLHKIEGHLARCTSWRDNGAALPPAGC